MNMLSILGNDVRENDGMISLTDLWKLSGSKNTSRPVDWMRTDQVAAFINEVAKGENTHLFVRIKPGRNGGTYAHWQIALAYAKFLSPKLHIAANEVFMRYRMGDITLAEDIVERTKAPVEDLARLEARTRVKITNKMINSRVFRAGGGPVTAKFVATTNSVALTGMTPRQLLESNGVKGKKSARDLLSTEEMIHMAFLESIEAGRIDKDKVRGHRDILDVVEEVAEDVSKLINTHTRIAVNA